VSHSTMQCSVQYGQWSTAQNICSAPLPTRMNTVNNFMTTLLDDKGKESQRNGLDIPVRLHPGVVATRRTTAVRLRPTGTTQTCGQRTGTWEDEIRNGAMRHCYKLLLALGNVSRVRFTTMHCVYVYNITVMDQHRCAPP
jgi:hypothetical protein